MAHTRHVPPVKTVEALIKPHLNYSEESGNYRKIRSLGRIIATHGTRVPDVGRLARDGHFSGGAQEADFSFSPNPDYKQWEKAACGEEVLQALAQKAIDPIIESITYAGTEPVDEIESAGYIESGVVIGFNANLLKLDPYVYIDAINDTPELAVPGAPGLETIEGIYPMDADAALRLENVLQFIRA